MEEQQQSAKLSRPNISIEALRNALSKVICLTNSQKLEIVYAVIKAAEAWQKKRPEVYQSCYVFKSRLQEYAQKAGLTTPIYHTIKEGPSHQPVFRSTVVLNEESYHSLTGFLNRKAAEQSAAEVALVAIAKTGTTDKSVSHPVVTTSLDCQISTTLSSVIMKKKGNEMESICSSSSNARLLTNEIESTFSSSSNARLLTKACNSVNASCCSSNRTHIKRPRFHMAQPGVKIKKSIRDEVQKFLGDYIPNPMFEACHANRDAFIKLLLSACDGTDNTMGSPDMPEIFWEKFTKRWVQDLKLDIVITEETVAACERFGSSLKGLYLGMEKTSRAIEKHRREQLCQPLQIKQSLFKVFGTRELRFRRKNSTGSSSKSSRSSKSARSIDASRLSDARGPSGASQSLRQDVNDDWNEWEPRLADALAALHSANLVTVAEVDLVSAQFRRSTTRVGLRLFLGKHLPADQVQYIRDMLANPPVV